MSENTAEKLREELNRFREQTGRALDALSGIREVDVGTSPKDLVYSEDKLKLYRYRSFDEAESDQGKSKKSKAARERPVVLICYALVNRPYMLDLQEDRSIIRQLLKRGVDVFLIDWGYPDGADRYLTFSDYVNGYLLRCVQKVCAVAGLDRLTLLGVCQGGSLSLCFTALHPEYIKNLITMVTPVDFQTDADTLSKWVQTMDVDALVDAMGNIPGELLNVAFLGLMPFRLTSQKYLTLLDSAGNAAQIENFVRMEKWIFDSPDQAGEMFREFIQWCYKENRLKLGTLELDGKRVNLKSIKVPVLNVYGLQDHLVPPASSQCLHDVVGSKDYEEIVLKSGHIGLYVSAKSQTELPDKLVAWLRKHQ